MQAVALATSVRPWTLWGGAAVFVFLYHACCTFWELVFSTLLAGFAPYFRPTVLAGLMLTCAVLSAPRSPTHTGTGVRPATPPLWYRLQVPSLLLRLLNAYALTLVLFVGAYVETLHPQGPVRPWWVSPLVCVVDQGFAAYFAFRVIEGSPCRRSVWLAYQRVLPLLLFPQVVCICLCDPVVG